MYHVHCADVEKPSNVVQGAAENLAPSISDLSLKDSAKSDSTGGDRLARDSVQSDYITPTSSVDCAKSDVTSGKLSQQSFGDRSEDRAETVSMKTKSVANDTPINVVSLLHSGLTLRYFISWYYNIPLMNSYDRKHSKSTQ